MVIIGVLSRLLPHVPNFTPIAATALFGGVYLPKKYAFIIPLLAMLISDYFIGFHTTMPYVYASFILTGAIGLWVRSHKNPGTILGGTLASSLLFFFITNAGVWLQGYQPTLIDSLVAGIPFFRNTVMGDLFYVGAFFGSYELVKKIQFDILKQPVS